ncbi:MAG TPA: GNAT family N-acetyltransferase [Stellaceae bacterium]|nr:GNAT family N-acetyltransferase [Stellaceae bacterium]
MSRKLRHATSADLARLARLHAFCFPEDRWDERALAELLAMPGASGHLIENVADKQPLALILDLINAGEGEILTLGVDPIERRQGLARALLKDLFARAKRAGVRNLSLEVAADNLAARRLYEGAGFSAVGRRRGYYRRGTDTIDALLFRRNLLDGGNDATCLE